jgi:hypothetical protein
MTTITVRLFFEAVCPIDEGLIKLPIISENEWAGWYPPDRAMVSVETRFNYEVPKDIKSKGAAMAWARSIANRLSEKYDATKLEIDMGEISNDKEAETLARSVEKAAN